MNLDQEKKGLPKGYGQKTIDGIQFTVAPFKAIEAIRLKTVLMKLFVPSLGQLFGGIGDMKKGQKFQDINLDGDVITKAIDKIFSELGEDEFIELIERFLKNTVCIAKVDGKDYPVQLDSEDGINTVFQGKTFTIYKVILLVLKVNYPDFFGQMEGIGFQLQTVLGNYLNQNGQENSNE